MSGHGWDALRELISDDESDTRGTSRDAVENASAGWDQLRALAEQASDASGGEMEGQGDCSAKKAGLAVADNYAEVEEEEEEEEADDDDIVAALGEEDEEPLPSDDQEGDEEGEEEEALDEDAGGDNSTECSEFDDDDGLLESGQDPLEMSGDDSDGSGLVPGLMSTFSGGTLGDGEGGRGVKLRPAGRASRVFPPGPKLVFPTLIWRGKGIMVVNKPAEWICSASDVDKRKGLKPDPNEKCSNKNFKNLEDLQNYKFNIGEKKYIHWWVQLIHDLDEDSYPNLFDLDENYGLCHRLDRETSGALLVGIERLARHTMRDCFHRHYVRKLYVCLVHGNVEPKEQTIDRSLLAQGNKAHLSNKGLRARTHVKVLGYFSSKPEDGTVEDYTLCTCEIAEGRMHQIRVHVAMAIGAPIVSELTYQDKRQMRRDRQWCPRVFLHAYGVGFPDVSGKSTSAMEQEWHCCICPLTTDLREALGALEPRGKDARALHKSLTESGLMSAEHQIVHCTGDEPRRNEIEKPFFPWASVVNPVQDGTIVKPGLLQQQPRPGATAAASRRNGSVADRARPARPSPREGGPRSPPRRRPPLARPPAPARQQRGPLERREQPDRREPDLREVRDREARLPSDEPPDRGRDAPPPGRRAPGQRIPPARRCGPPQARWPLDRPRSNQGAPAARSRSRSRPRSRPRSPLRVLLKARPWADEAPPPDWQPPERQSRPLQRRRPNSDRLYSGGC